MYKEFEIEQKELILRNQEILDEIIERQEDVRLRERATRESLVPEVMNNLYSQLLVAADDEVGRLRQLEGENIGFHNGYIQGAREASG